MSKPADSALPLLALVPVVTARVRRACWRYRVSLQAAEDLVHDVLVIALTTREQGRREGTLAPWLMGVADNVVRMHARRAIPRTSVCLDGVPEPPANCGDPATWAEAKETVAIRWGGGHGGLHNSNGEFRSATESGATYGEAVQLATPVSAFPLSS
jgi:DNA-directed RNA polymerase specialized sigma24 family protein